MKIASVLLLLSVIFPIANKQLSAQDPTDYGTAYENAQATDRPLLVLVTAEWCPPCQRMKSTTIPELMARDAFGGFHFAAVDYDQENELARDLIGDRGVPQLLMFEKHEDRWIRRYITGYKTAATVEAFIAQANVPTRTASSENSVETRQSEK